MDAALGLREIIPLAHFKLNFCGRNSMDSHSWPDPPGQTAFPVAKAGYPAIFGAAFVTLIFALLGMPYLSLLGLLVTFCFCGFFRDPDRVIPNQPYGIVSPADGKIILAGPVDRTSFYDGGCQKISIFMSVFNVHVNRIPFDGRVKKVSYSPGKFFAANLDKASLQNEHNAVLLETAAGKRICTIQVAGLIARRIICRVQPEDDVSKGQRYGMICFGSRLDVYLPDDVEIKVNVGDKVKAGSSVIGRFTVN
jgi:phosphatidylserine decarboxylase